MRAAGWTIQELQVQRNRAALRRQHEVVIICAGESTTQGDVLSGRYPEMLEGILARQNLGAGVTVVNLGLAGAASSDVVRALAIELKSMSPAVVVAMLGINDAGNTHSYRSMIAAGEGRWYGRWRLYKFYRVLRAALVGAWPWLVADDELMLGEGIVAPYEAPDPVALREWYASHPPSAARDPQTRAALVAISDRLARGHSAGVERELRRLINDDPGFADPYAVLADILRRGGRDAEAHDVLVRGLAKAAGVAPGLAAALAQSHAQRGEHDLAVAMQRRVLDEMIEPANLGGRIHHTIGLAHLFERAGRLDDAEAALREVVERIHPGNAVLYGELIAFYERIGRVEAAEAARELQRRIRYEYVNPQTRANYAALRQLVGERDIPLVAAQYPGRDVATLWRLLDGDDSVLYVDNGFFRDLVAGHGYERYFRDRFAGDMGHLTPEGNCLLAANIARTITTLVFGVAFDDTAIDCPGAP